MQEITVEELARRRQSAEPFVLLDVREPDEVATVKIDGALWIPMGQIPQRIGELDPSVPTAVMCHHGGRSERVAAFLRAHGFKDVMNVDGGIDAYAQRIDTSLSRY